MSGQLLHPVPRAAQARGDARMAACWWRRSSGRRSRAKARQRADSAAFVRLSRCQLACAWCDTPYTWDRTRYDLGAESRRIPQAEVWQAIKAIGARLVVITGGEPLLQQDRLVWLAGMCQAAGWRARSRPTAPSSPALPSLARPAGSTSRSSSPTAACLPSALRPDAIRTLAASDRAVWKFVVTSPADLEEIAGLQQRYGLDPVWVMPEGTTSRQILRRMRELADPVLARGWNLTPRLHTLLWGDQHGR